MTGRVHGRRLALLSITCMVLMTLLCVGRALASEAGWSLRHTEFDEALFTDDHVSEGVLLPLTDGTLLLVFRLDPGIEGDHVGTNGYIAQMPYDPATDTWRAVSTVYNSNQFDDRNIHGGVTRAGRIVVFFRRYAPPDTEGFYFIYSDDHGETWSDLQTSDVLRGVAGTGQLFYNPEIGKYCIMQYDWRGTHRNDILFSDDGSVWEESRVVAESQPTALSEIAGAWCGSGRVVALIRDDARRRGHPLLQIESRDNGRTWSEPQQTNIPPEQHWGAAPQLLYDQKRDLLIALNSDRYTRPDAENSLFVYTARPDEIFEEPTNWTLQFELERPWAKADFDKDRPLNRIFYGYPTIAPINEDEYLVVFTENATMNGREQADLYYFRLIFDPAD